MRRARKLLYVACLALLPTATGCQKSDADALVSIGSRIAQRTHGLAEQFQQKCPTLPGSLESRIRQRLQSDKALVDTSIEVIVDDKNVELKGNLPTPDQMRRAVELAESTVGVDNVTNSLNAGLPQ